MIPYCRRRYGNVVGVMLRSGWRGVAGEVEPWLLGPRTIVG